MDHAILLARIFGPLYIIIALWVLLRTDHVTNVLATIKTNQTLLYLGGTINLLLGLVILALYSTWSWHLVVILTIIGWAQLIRGILVFFAPQVFV
ncbi:MAG: hypothetical protein JSR46_08220, partial [Verrucomicrobia bacterium]|nr:hypothetical protein [Verrucomicrobiota bacterium]